MISLLLITWGIVIVMMLLFWVYYLTSKNPGIVDLGWVCGIFLAGQFLLLQNLMSTRNMIISLLLMIWALRLGGFLLLTRVLKKEIDKRYVKLSSGWKMKQSLGFLINYQFQGFLLMFIVVPFYYCAHSPSYHFTLTDYLAFIFVVCGIVFEAIADQQLNRFKKKHSGGVCNVGLWKYSRHPNYFFEWLVWLGFELFALATPMGWVGLISPIALFVIMWFITIPITEQGSLDSRGAAFEQYQQQTSTFFPWFSRS